LIAGGGIGGLCVALALLRAGADATVFEQAAELTEVGAGVQLSANGTRVLYALGVGEAMRALAVDAQGKEIRLWNTGQTWKLFDLGAESVRLYGFPYFTVYRPDLLAVLAEGVRRAKPDAIRLNAKVRGFEQSADGVALRLASGETVPGDALIGADGVHSTIRAQLFGDDQAHFTGLVAWRGVVAMARLPRHMARLVGLNWVGPGSHVVNYPLRRGELMNFVGIRERADWQVESWSAQGTPDELARDFAGWHDDVQAMIHAIDTPHKWALAVRPPLERWTVGRVTLLGDACHPMVPMLAQGAVMALEDGYILARALQESDFDVASALQRYERARLERTRQAVIGSSANAERFHNAKLGDAREAQRFIGHEWAEARVKQRYEWLFRYDVTTVPL
jgi:salicylate hydroxylase